MASLVTLSVLALSLAIGSATRADAQEALFAPASDVSFDVSTAQSSYMRGEGVVVTYRITNLSSRPLFVPAVSVAGCPTVGFHVLILFEGDNGYREVISLVSSCSQSIPPVVRSLSRRMQEEAVFLRPGEHLDFTTVKKFPSGWPSGTYRLSANLSGWSPEQLSAEERVELRRLPGPILQGQKTAFTNVSIREANETQPSETAIR